MFYIFLKISCLSLLLDTARGECLIKTMDKLGVKMCEAECNDHTGCDSVYYDRNLLRCHLLITRIVESTCAVGEQIIHLQTKDICFSGGLSSKPPGTVVHLRGCIFAQCDSSGEWFIEDKNHPQGCLLLSDMSEGLLQVYHEGVWGTVCDDYFGSIEAQVVCSFLGYNSGTLLASGGGDGEIWMDDVNCTGIESHLFDCSHLGWGSHNCRHYEDVRLRCT